MKKFFVLAMIFVMSIGLLAVNASEEEGNIVYINEKKNSQIAVNFYAGELYISVEDIFEYFGYDVHTRRTSYNRVEISLDGKELATFVDSSTSNNTRTTFTDKGRLHFKLDKDDLELGYYTNHTNAMRIYNDRYFAHYTDVQSLLNLNIIYDADISGVAIFTDNNSPNNVTLYNQKGIPIKVVSIFKDQYIEAGYKTNLEDVLIIPESKKVSADGVKVSLNGGFLEFDVNPSIINGRTMVPLRMIFESLSATVEWNSETNTVVSKKDDITISLTVDSDKMIINDKTVVLDCPATIIDGRTLVPVRAVSEAFRIQVSWDAENQIVILREPKYAEIETVFLYNISNQMVEVPAFDTENYIKDGWLTEKPVTMYALDGRTQVVVQAEVDANKAVGWYTTPVKIMYAEDGRSLVVPQKDTDAYKAVGWYDYPVSTMYAADGRTMLVPCDQVEAYKAVGWYIDKHDVLTTMYAPDGSHLQVYKAEVAAYKATGWFENHSDVVVKMFSLDGRHQDVYKSNIASEQAVGWYLLDDCIAELINSYGFETALNFLDNMYSEYTYSWSEPNAIDVSTYNAKYTEILNNYYKATGCPVVVLSWSRGSNSIGTPEIHVTFRNLSQKTIVAYEHKFTCYDAYGNRTTDYSWYNGDFTGYSTNQNIKSGAKFSATWTLYSNERTHKISWPYILKVAFSDGSTWYR